MEAILVKVFATALALSLVMTQPDAVKTQFDPVQDKAEVLKILGAGCDHMRKAFDIENIDLDGLIDTVMTDKQAAAGEVAGFKGINFGDLHLAYKQFCKHEKINKEVQGMKFEIKGSKISGNNATLKVQRSKGEDVETGEVRLVLENGEWKMTP